MPDELLRMAPLNSAVRKSMPTELIWDGKYNADGTKKAPLRVELPFQAVETVNESAQDRQRMLDLFSYGQTTSWRNRLIWGDKKYVLPSLLPEFAGKVDLIYIDPPFATGDDFSFQVDIEGSSFMKEPSLLEQKAYRDTWGRGLDSYLQWFYETAILLYELLSEKGSLYVHLDWHVGHYAKVILDEIFGIENFHNHITWKRSTPRGNSYRRYPELTDYIFFYAKTDNYPWNDQYGEYRQEYIDKYYQTVDSATGRKFQPTSLLGHVGVNPVYEWRGLSKPWRYPKHRLEELDKAGLLYWPERGDVPRLKRFLDEQKGMPIQSLWDDIPPVNSQAKEDTGYNTQKPEAFLERVIKASSNEGDLVLDCFCGSGTTAVVAEKLSRRWITCDLGRFAIHTTRKRLLNIPSVKPFIVQNLGKYERQLWQAEEFGPNAEQRLTDYTRFVADLYQAQPLAGYAWLHGVKGGRVIHVGSVDSPVTLADVRSIIREWRGSLGRSGAASNGIDVLGWEFAFELNETARQQAQESGVDLRFLTIPREVLEKKAVDQGDIQFFELAALFVEHQIKGRELTLEMTNFIAPLEYVPQEVREKITKWESWVDYWAVDFNFRDDTFHNEWQSYRTRKDKALTTKVQHCYDAPGTYQIQVKVIDIGLSLNKL
jgi:adenine-specific DNA-methyltransferase